MISLEIKKEKKNRKIGVSLKELKKPAKRFLIFTEKPINPPYPPCTIKGELKEGFLVKVMVGDTGFEPVTSTV